MTDRKCAIANCDDEGTVKVVCTRTGATYWMCEDCADVHEEMGDVCRAARKVHKKCRGEGCTDCGWYGLVY